MSKDLPTTDDFKLEVNIDLPLAKLFWSAAQGLDLEDMLSLAIPAAARRSVDVEVEEVRASSQYILQSEDDNAVFDEKVLFTKMSVQDRLGMYFGVIPDDLPPVPPELTPELLDFLVALHESEHATQIGVKEPLLGQKVLFNKSLIGRADWPKDYMPGVIAHESDADLAVVTYLKDEGLGHVAQFWLDARTIGSFTKKFPENDALYKHETATIVSHYLDHEEVLDPEILYVAKKSLIGKVCDEMDITSNFANGTAGVFASVGTKDPTKEEWAEAMSSFPRMPPGKIRFALESLLEKKVLQGLEKLEAENFIAAAERRGYKADADPVDDYKHEVRTALAELYGVHFVADDNTEYSNESAPLSSP